MDKFLDSIYSDGTRGFESGALSNLVSKFAGL